VLLLLRFWPFGEGPWRMESGRGGRGATRRFKPGDALERPRELLEHANHGN
jgi:hypothetical protein